MKGSFSLPPAPLTSALNHEELISDARAHYSSLGYRVHSGLQFGCELVLYADDPELVHSDFCVVVLPPDGRVDWRRIQCLTRSMGDWKKTLILAEVRAHTASEDEFVTAAGTTEVDGAQRGARRKEKVVRGTEIAVSTEHAPFRHGRQTISTTGTVDIGSQHKKQKIT